MCPSCLSSARVSSIFCVNFSSFFSLRDSFASETACDVLAAAPFPASATLDIASLVALAACFDNSAILLPVEPSRSASVLAGLLGE